ncbi:MAG: aminotransferase class V-fold PLP-dependent enzyme [Synergistetes bacterium]|nr:aminotransferase class V-fold PLP-dependent enzyme [Synergistota bacterium]
MTRSIYMNYASLTPLDERVLKEMMPFLERWSEGKRAVKAVELSRIRLSKLLSCSPKEVFFTASRAEAFCLAIYGILRNYAWRGKHIIVSQIDSDIVIGICKILEERGYSISYVSVDRYGRVSPREIERLLRDETVLVSIPLASVDIGTIQPVAELSEFLKKREVFLHVDGVPGLTWISLDLRKIRADLITLSSSHIYGPGGVSALYISQRLDFQPPSFLRNEIENIANIVGFGVAAEILLSEREGEIRRIAELRNMLEIGIREKISGIFFCGHKIERLPGILSVCVNYIGGKVLANALREEGIDVGRSREETLVALGIPPELAKGGIVFSLGRWSTHEDIEKLLSVLPSVIEKLRRMTI